MAEAYELTLPGLRQIEAQFGVELVLEINLAAEDLEVVARNPRTHARYCATVLTRQELQRQCYDDVSKRILKAVSKVHDASPPP